MTWRVNRKTRHQKNFHSVFLHFRSFETFDIFNMDYTYFQMIEADFKIQ